MPEACLPLKVFQSVAVMVPVEVAPPVEIAIEPLEIERGTLADHTQVEVVTLTLFHVTVETESPFGSETVAVAG